MSHRWSLGIVLWIIGTWIAGCGESTLLPPDAANVDGDGDAAFQSDLDGSTSTPRLDGNAADARTESDASSTSDGGTVLQAECAPALCDAAPPIPHSTGDWNNVLSNLVARSGSPTHRGRDLYLREGDPQWAVAQFGYGVADQKLTGEDVEVWLHRDCATWEFLGEAQTTSSGDHAEVEGVDDSGGFVFFEIGGSQTLSLGRHRVHFIVRGDETSVDQFIEVLPMSARFVVSDVDGTLTTDENAQVSALFTGNSPDANSGAPEVLNAYAARGYRIFYLTARPQWLEARTHEWLRERGFPEGNVHTSLSFTGALGRAAEEYKIEELAALGARFPNGVHVAYGNTETDMGAYAASHIAVSSARSFQFDPGHDGTRFDDWNAEVSQATAAPNVCE